MQTNKQTNKHAQRRLSFHFFTTVEIRVLADDFFATCSVLQPSDPAEEERPPDDERFLNVTRRYICHIIRRIDSMRNRQSEVGGSRGSDVEGRTRNRRGRQ